MEKVDQDYKITLAERLKKVAYHFGLQEQELAQRLGITKQAMSNYTQARNEPKPSLLANLVNVFGINPAWMLTGKGEMLGEAGTTAPSGIPPEELSEKLTPAQREMLTYKRTMQELGAAPERIIDGIEAIAMGRTRSPKSAYATAEPSAAPGYNNIHEPGSDFGKDI